MEIFAFLRSFPNQNENLFYAKARGLAKAFEWFAAESGPPCSYVTIWDSGTLFFVFSVSPFPRLPADSFAILFSVSLVRDCRGVGVNALRMHPCMRRHLVQLPLELFPSWHPPLAKTFNRTRIRSWHTIYVRNMAPHTFYFTLPGFSLSLPLPPPCAIRISLPFSLSVVCGQPATCGTKLKAFACSTSSPGPTRTVIKCSPVRCRRWETRINRKPKSAHSI